MKHSNRIHRCAFISLRPGVRGLTQRYNLSRNYFRSQTPTSDGDIINTPTLSAADRTAANNPAGGAISLLAGRSVNVILFPAAADRIGSSIAMGPIPRSLLRLG